MKNMGKEKSRYISFLLRLWLADDDGDPVSRLSLESPLSGECKGFANLDELLSYLRLLSNLKSEDAHNENG
jgi:hypothetical protein